MVRALTSVRPRSHSAAASVLLCSLIALAGAACDETADPAESGDAGSWQTSDAGSAVVPDAGSWDAGGGLDAGLRGDGGAQAPDGSTGGSDASVDASAPRSNLCKLHGYEIGMVGDSYIHLTSFSSVLADITRKAGALPANESYVDHALSGASMDGFPNIPAQWPDVVAAAKGRGASKVKLTIMTGGGNDVLVNNRYCLDFPTQAEVSDACKNVVTKAIQRGQELVDQAVKDGLEEVIYFFYPHLPKGGIGGGPYPNTILDYALPRVREFCERQTALKCHFVDLVPAFDDGTGFARPGLINIDGIHPTAEGTKLMADVIWKKMQEQCLGSMAP